MTFKKGYALATILILLGVAMFGAGAIVTISRLESKISRSEQEAVTAYYVAEAGVEDAMWRLNNDTTYSTPLVNGTLNATYTATNFPLTGQNFVVTLVTDNSKGAGYGTVTVVGTSNNGDFTASRQVITSVFKGSNGVTTGGNVLFSAGTTNFNTISNTMNLSAGGMYSSGAISFSSAKVTIANPYAINGVGTYSAVSSTVNSGGGIHSSNNPPATTALTTPNFSFSNYGTAGNYTTKYTPAQFTALFCNACAATVSLSGVTYVSGAVTMPATAKNKTMNINGMLVIAGNFTLANSITGFTSNITDPGTGKSGLFVSGATNIANGNWSINGVVYTVGTTTLAFGNSTSFNVNGALISGGNLSINASVALNFVYVDSRVSATVGNGPATVIQVQHWEEQY
jgi:Tfp pilus assembly protein PilX